MYNPQKGRKSQGVRWKLVVQHIGISHLSNLKALSEGPEVPSTPVTPHLVLRPEPPRPLVPLTEGDVLHTGPTGQNEDILDTGPREQTGEEKRKSLPSDVSPTVGPLR